MPGMLTTPEEIEGKMFERGSDTGRTSGVLPSLQLVMGAWNR